MKLPPKPDPDTGLPKPPEGPLENSWGKLNRRPTDRSSLAPVPPPGQSPTLEWVLRTGKTFRGTALTCLLLSLVVLTLKDWGIGWMSVWWLWFLALGLSALAGLVIWSTGAMAAGADWFWYVGSWVQTYELTEIKLNKAWGPDELKLKDADGHEIWIETVKIQKNPDLWDLVYNGILHSVHYGGAIADERARNRLHLDLDDRLPSGDDPV
jgi:hypothetical protein